MTNHLLRRATVGWGTLLGAVAAMLALASMALAVQTDQYNRFTTCPTDAPELNDPASEFGICMAATAQGNTLKIGDLSLPVSRLGIQFGATALTLNEPHCPRPGICLGRVPGTTTVESSTSELRVNPSGREHPKGNGKGVRMNITIESAGDVRAVSPGILFGVLLPLFELPIKLHVEAPWVPQNCYIGSDSKPIFLVPSAIAPAASFGIFDDPNGFNIVFIKIIGLPSADRGLAIPAARGCGHGQHPKPHSQADGLVNDLLGLPSPAGANELLLPSFDLLLASAGFDGTPPDGGATLKAAFDAAK